MLRSRFISRLLLLGMWQSGNLHIDLRGDKIGLLLKTLFRLLFNSRRAYPRLLNDAVLTADIEICKLAFCLRY
jgi:hypothetical protein